MTPLQQFGAVVVALCVLGLLLWLAWERGYKAGERAVRAEVDRLRDHIHDRLSERLARYAPHDAGRTR